jgi:hypothetical protein
MKFSIKKMFPALLSLVVLGSVPMSAQANDFPTTTRVEYVLECMQKHNRDYEYFYKCSCVVDDIAKNVNYNEFNEILTATRYARLGGERGSVFRDPKEVKRMSKKYRTLEANANKACFVKAPADDD